MVNTRKKEREVAKKAAPAPKPSHNQLEANEIIPQVEPIEERAYSQPRALKSSLSNETSEAADLKKPKRKVRFAKNAAGAFLEGTLQISGNNSASNDPPSPKQPAAKPWYAPDSAEDEESDIDPKGSDNWEEDEEKTSDTDEENSESNEEGQFHASRDGARV
jgi:hypothetical protein